MCCAPAPPPAGDVPAPEVVGVSQIEKFDCNGHPYPIQVLWEKKNGAIATKLDNFYRAAVKQLDVPTGAYKTIYSVSKDSVQGLTNLNACAINPVDSIAYCWVQIDTGAKNGYVVRIGDEKVEFVAVMPGQKVSAAATVGRSGTYYFQDSGLNKMYAIPDIARKAGSTKPKDALSVAASGMKGSKAPGMTKVTGMLHDIVAVSNVDLDGSGDNVDYLVSLSYWNSYKADPPKVFVMKMSTDATIEKTWILRTVDEAGGDLPKSAFGAAWNFDNHIFFSANDGQGVFEVPIESMDLPAQNVLHEAVKVDIHRTYKVEKNQNQKQYNAYATFAIGTAKKFAFQTLQTNTHIRVGLTSDPADTSEFPQGRALHIFPGSRLSGSSGFPESTHAVRDVMVLTIQGSQLVVLQNNEVIHTWDYDFGGTPVFAKIFLYEYKAAVQILPDPIVVKSVGASDPTSYNDGMNCLQVHSPWPGPDPGRCKKNYVEAAPVNGECSGYILGAATGEA